MPAHAQSTVLALVTALAPHELTFDEWSFDEFDELTFLGRTAIAVSTPTVVVAPPPTVVVALPNAKSAASTSTASVFMFLVAAASAMVSQ